MREDSSLPLTPDNVKGNLLAVGFFKYVSVRYLESSRWQKVLSQILVEACITGTCEFHC
jgi:hypothetical protein